MKEKVIGIMGAMPEEINSIMELLEEKHLVTIGKRAYTSGKINGIKVVVVFSRWGKVAAATTVSTLILEFKITELIFTGVAGAINHQLRIGDIVIARRLIQHDMDARPLMAQYEIPLLNITFFDVQEVPLAAAGDAISGMLEVLGGLIEGNAFHITQPRLFVGDIASGDRFFADSQAKASLQKQLPSILCVEMEGAAVAQVCHEYDIPYIVIRTISDVADEQSPIDFASFIRQISNRYSMEIIRRLI